MITVDAQVYRWTPVGMKPGRSSNGGGYITISEVERLLAEAHARGKRVGLEAAMQVVRETK